jgi:hypothetical protein
MSFCQPCREVVAQNRKAARWVAFLLALSLFFTMLGLITHPTIMPGMCKIYP